MTGPPHSAAAVTNFLRKALASGALDVRDLEGKGPSGRAARGTPEHHPRETLHSCQKRPPCSIGSKSFRCGRCMGLATAAAACCAGSRTQARAREGRTCDWSQGRTRDGRFLPKFISCPQSCEDETFPAIGSTVLLPSVTIDRQQQASQSPPMAPIYKRLPYFRSLTRELGRARYIFRLGRDVVIRLSPYPPARALWQCRCLGHLRRSTVIAKLNLCNR